MLEGRMPESARRGMETKLAEISGGEERVILATGRLLAKASTTRAGHPLSRPAGLMEVESVDEEGGAAYP